MLVADALVKRYGDRIAVDGVTLRVNAGEILGLLGPNGAGKSTTIGMISGLVAPDAGSVSVRGTMLAQDPLGFRHRIGLVPQDLALYEQLGALANLELFGALYGVRGRQLRERAAAALALVGLGERAHDKPETFSGGMKRRLNIAAALVHDPDVLLLDEPTAGVDPQSRNAIFENLEALKRNGKAIVYTTHYMEEVERLADHITILDHGKVVAAGTLPALLQQLPDAQNLEFDLAGTPPMAAIAALPGVRRASYEGSRLRVVTDDMAAVAPLVLQALSAANIRVQRMGSQRATLEDVFLALTGNQLRDST